MGFVKKCGHTILVIFEKSLTHVIALSRAKINLSVERFRLEYMLERLEERYYVWGTMSFGILA